MFETKESVLSITIMSTGPNMYTEQLRPLLKFLVILIWIFNTNFVYTIQYTFFRWINGQFFLKKDLYENWPEIFNVFYASEFSYCLMLKFQIHICDCNYVFMACKFPSIIFLETVNVGVEDEIIIVGVLSETPFHDCLIRDPITVSS